MSWKKNTNGICSLPSFFHYHLDAESVLTERERERERKEERERERERERKKERERKEGREREDTLRV